MCVCACNVCMVCMHEILLTDIDLHLFKKSIVSVLPPYDLSNYWWAVNYVVAWHLLIVTQSDDMWWWIDQGLGTVLQKVNEPIIEILKKGKCSIIWYTVGIVRSLIWTCHNSSAVVTCAKLGPGLIVPFHVILSGILQDFDYEFINCLWHEILFIRQ